MPLTPSPQGGRGNLDPELATSSRIYYVDPRRDWKTKEHHTMQATVKTWGNSLALRLPRHLAEQLQLADGSVVDLTIENGALKLIPARRKFKLAELLADEPRRAAEGAEFDWGKPAGEE